MNLLSRKLGESITYNDFKSIKYLGIKLNKEVKDFYNRNSKTLKKENYYNSKTRQSTNELVDRIVYSQNKYKWQININECLKFFAIREFQIEFWDLSVSLVPLWLTNQLNVI